MVVSLARGFPRSRQQSVAFADKTREPILHRLYTFDEAITSFGNETLPEFFATTTLSYSPRPLN
jgi:hypothetical protein